jgi:hypothetical protein
MAEEPRDTGRVTRPALLLALALASCTLVGARQKPSTQTTAHATQGGSAPMAVPAGGLRIPLNEDAALLLADVESARKLIVRRDAFVANMSLLDRQARIGRKGDVSEAELLTHFAAQVRAFSPVHVERIRAAAKVIGSALTRERIALALPSDVVVVLTSGLEEAGGQVGVGYTREGIIYLNERALEESPSYLLSHELFHVYGHHHPETREKLYAAIGFMPLGARVVWPEPVEARRVSNPDSPHAEHAIRVRYQGKDVLAVYVCLADGTEVVGPNLFNQVSTYYAVLDPAQPERGRPGADVELANYHAFEGFFEQVGYNTGYLAGPEEILADNFEMLLEHPERARTPALLATLREVMAAK